MAVVAKTVTVRHDAARVPPGVLLAALNAADLQATLANATRDPAAAAASAASAGDPDAAPAGPARRLWRWAAGAARAYSRNRRWPPITVVLCGILLGVSLVSYAPELPEGGPQPRSFAWAAVAAAAVGGWPVLRKARVALMNWTLEINSLMILAVAGERRRRRRDCAGVVGLAAATVGAHGRLPAPQGRARPAWHCGFAPGEVAEVNRISCCWPRHGQHAGVRVQRRRAAHLSCRCTAPHLPSARTGAIALGDYVEAASIVFLFGLAEWLEERCVQQVQ